MPPGLYEDLPALDDPAASRHFVLVEREREPLGRWCLLTGALMIIALIVVMFALRA
jgi:hypothetical protein